jgi:hypothetical protein
VAFAAVTHEDTHAVVHEEIQAVKKTMKTMHDRSAACASYMAVPSARLHQLPTTDDNGSLRQSRGGLRRLMCDNANLLTLSKEDITVRLSHGPVGKMPALTYTYAGALSGGGATVRDGSRVPST